MPAGCIGVSGGLPGDMLKHMLPTMIGGVVAKENKNI
jgi:hypothetical protein